MCEQVLNKWKPFDEAKVIESEGGQSAMRVLPCILSLSSIEIVYDFLTKILIAMIVK